MPRLSGAIVLSLGVFSLIYSYSLSLGELTNPGPGLWPFIISVTIILGAAALLITERDNEDYEHFTPRVRLIGFGLLSLAVFIILFAQIGFVIPSLLTLAFWLRFLGEESWRMTLVISVLCTSGFYVLFVTLLGVPFPDDVLISLLGS